MANEIIDKNNFDTSNFLSKTFSNLAEGLTGLASTDKKEIFLSIGYILQKIRSGKFLKTFESEWNKFREKGKIKDDYLNSTQHQECLQEMLDFLDKDSPDDIRFQFIKNIFIITATEEVSNRDSILPQQYMKIARTLSSGEVLVLNAAYKKAEFNDWNRDDTNTLNWLDQISRLSNLGFSELVELHENKLIEKNLITPRKHSDKSGVVLGEHYRLTNLGYGLCDFIKSFDG